MTDRNPCIFRVRRISEPGWHHIMVPQQGHVICSCNGESWCSHIDATLLSGERHMVHQEDRQIANKAQVLAKGRIAPTDKWRANWRNNRRWRGLPKKETMAERIINAGEPVCSVEGKTKDRHLATQIATDHGWRVVSRPTKGVIVHITTNKESRASEHASGLNIMVVSLDEWPNIAPIGDSLRNRISTLMKQGHSS